MESILNKDIEPGNAKNKKSTIDSPGRIVLKRLIKNNLYFCKINNLDHVGTFLH